MEFKINEKKNPHIEKYKDDELKIAMEFSKHCMKEFGSFIKAIVLFGSVAKKRGTHKRDGSKPHDVDLLLILNDVTIALTPEFMETYKIILTNIIQRTSDRIHVTPIMMTNFWELVKSGDPIIINMLRDGVPIIDSGIFEPMQVLLYRGRVRPTWESIWAYYERAPHSLHNSKKHILQAVVDLYWAVIDSAHAALMTCGEVPPSPSHVADILEKKLLPKKLIKKHHVSVMRDFYHLSKKIVKGEITYIHGRDYERYLKEAEDFVQVMKRIIDIKKNN
jgi:uncharacterized protein (UPF0332 family)/predicted nucleotidyltransferase